MQLDVFYNQRFKRARLFIPNHKSEWEICGESTNRATRVIMSPLLCFSNHLHLEVWDGVSFTFVLLLTVAEINTHICLCRRQTDDIHIKVFTSSWVQWQWGGFPKMSGAPVYLMYVKCLYELLHFHMQQILQARNFSLWSWNLWVCAVRPFEAQMSSEWQEHKVLQNMGTFLTSRKGCFCSLVYPQQ